MPLSFFRHLNCFNCFRREQPEVIIATSTSYGNDSASRSAASLEKHRSKLSSEKIVIETRPSSPPRTNPALLVVGKRQYDIQESYPFPTLAHEGEVIVRTKAVGLNPIDWKSVEYGFCLPEFPWVTGREMAGVVEKVGSGVTDITVGQRVWTSTYYRDRRAGCFQHYVTVPQHTVLPIPTGMSFEEASCLGVAALTAAMSLWHWLEVAGSPTTEPQTIPKSGYLLIWGGSTITGQFAIQIAVLGGLKVIAVTSSKTAEVAKRLGASHVVIRDGKSGEELVSEIRAIAGDELTRGIDLVGPETASLCLTAFSTTQRVLFAPLAMISSKAEVPQNISVETVEMKQFVLNESSQAYAHALNRLVEQGKLVLPELTVLDGGLQRVVEGLERIKKGDMAGKKVIVRM
ncbi:chaperonin 10-like protein [Stachybotrys elegans]|uniref:Chaperonin 10-like protein n=1 Tax=Stachybotrys elegans TaxID=80388 RepID=A0A8K0WUF7_9HYPO|nr:chaperonin 10-like protein [Stachybotrys elegans]